MSMVKMGGQRRGQGFAWDGDDGLNWAREDIGGHDYEYRRRTEENVVMLGLW
ncbi:hypothetical protein [Cytobacillus firmus]|uniref:hypothetical protein n=1 Tax=Cytobacillus firmus TaxID=1399 RepID=UPI0018CE160D|nr:hypothetical protein [Cytobacillus firmus]